MGVKLSDQYKRMRKKIEEYLKKQKKNNINKNWSLKIEKKNVECNFLKKNTFKITNA